MVVFYRGDTMINQNQKRILGSRIMQKRKLSGLSQHDFGRMIGLSEHQVSNIETGRSFPRMQAFLDICRVLDTNADYFLSGILKRDVNQNIIDLISSCSIEEQKIIWKLLDTYLHKDMM